MQGLKVLVYKPGAEPEEVILDPDNPQAELHQILGENIHGMTTPEGLLLLLDRDGITKELPANLFINGLTIFGPVVVAKADGGGNLITMSATEFRKAKSLERGDMRC